MIRKGTLRNYIIIFPYLLLLSVSPIKSVLYVNGKIFCKSNCIVLALYCLSCYPHDKCKDLAVEISDTQKYKIDSCQMLSVFLYPWG